MADEVLRFDVIGDDHLSGPFSRAGASVGELSRKMDIAALNAKILDDALKRQRSAAGVSADASLALARADKILEEAEHGLRDGALEAEFALKRETEAAKKAAEETRKAAAENKKAADGWQGFADKMKSGGGPAWLGPALLGLPAVASLGGVAAGAAAGLGGAFIAGAGALAAFGAVAKPVFADAQKAAQAVEKAQNNYNIAIAAGTKQSVAYKAEQVAIAKAYSELSPAQIALSKQLQAMGNAWQAVKAAQTPVVAGALQPWLKSVTDLTKNLGPIIAAVSPVIRGLGTQFDALINSAAFRGFRDFVAGTGTAAVSAVGSTLIDFVKGFIILLPKFDPLIREAVGWISRLGPAFVTWASSQKTADRIQAFMSWFSRNGPVVGGLLRNIAGALKAMAPGLQAGGIAELQAMSAFFGLVAKLPPGVAKPLFEVAGALLILNKLGVVSVGFKLLGMDAAKAAAGGGAGGLWGKILPGVGLVGGALIATVAVKLLLGAANTGKPGADPWNKPFGTDPTSKNTAKQGISTWAGLGNQITQIWDTMWRNTITRTARGFHDLAGWFDKGRHDVAAIWNLLWDNTVARGQRGLNDSDRYIAIFQRNLAHWFDLGRHDVAVIWDATWSSTVSRAGRGVRDVAGWLDAMRHGTAARFDGARHDTAAIWDSAWNNTVGRTIRGVSDTMRWIGTLPGRIGGVFRGAGNWLFGQGQAIITGLWNGIRNVWNTVAGWFAGLPSQILHALGIHSPPDWAVSAGGHIMGGILKGLAHGAADVKGFFLGLATDVAGPFKSIWSTIGGIIIPGGGGVASGGVAAAQIYARDRLAAYGWGLDQMAPLIALWNQESGWRWNALNPSSGAYGIPQSLPAGKMAAAGADWRTNPATQINWGLAYIKSAYGSPAGAEAHERAFNWYDTGYGILPRGLSLSLNTTGQPEMLQPARASGGGRSAPAILIEHLHVHAPVGSNPRDIGRTLAEYLGQFKKGGGWIYRPGGF